MAPEGMLSNALATLPQADPPMSAELRWEQCCESRGCTKPAYHGVLCAACFRAATPARRAVELLASAPEVRSEARVSDAGAAWLAELWAA
jgi:hypothetical protein